MMHYDLHLRAGEVQATPVLPSDEVDKLASQSAGLSINSGVLGTRSGLPECMPDNKVKQQRKEGLIHKRTTA